MKYCDNDNCNAEATCTVAASTDRPHDSKRHYCETCAAAYWVGVQHGRKHEAAVHHVRVGSDSSQSKPKKIRLTKSLIKECERNGLYL